MIYLIYSQNMYSDAHRNTLSIFKSRLHFAQLQV